MADATITSAIAVVKADAVVVETKAVSIYNKTKAWIIAHVPHAATAVVGYLAAKFSVFELVIKAL